jgi:phospholipid N-methyltransferase
MDKKMFLYKFLQSPQNVGSITPSSCFLAQAMMRPIDWENTHSIVELGAGTGTFTRLIQEKKRKYCQVFIFEQEREMREQLQLQYPFFHYSANAKDIYSTIQKLNYKEIDCVISGLPFANFSDELRDHIMEEVLRSLKPGGLFIAFQYSLHMKKSLALLFKETNISFVPINLPPAFVYYCRKDHAI